METASQGWVLRWQGTKNKSGSIYLVYLKHTMDPTFLNLWDSINWSPGLAATPYQGLSLLRTGSKEKDPFLSLSFCTVCHITSYIFQSLTISVLTPTKSYSPKHRFDQASLSTETMVPQKGSTSLPSILHNRLIKVWNVCSGSSYFRKQLSRIRLIMRGRQSFCPLLRNNSYVEHLY